METIMERSLDAASVCDSSVSKHQTIRRRPMLVKEEALEQSEERFLGRIINLGLLIVAIAGLVSSRNENPAVPLRLWTFVYALQCTIHSVFMFKRYPSPQLLSKSSSTAKDTIALELQQAEDHTSVLGDLEFANTMFSIIWWIVGICLVYTGGLDLTLDSPQLCGLCIAFLAIDALFVLCCATVVCASAVIVCFGIPCTSADLYAVAGQKGASKEDIDQLPKYKFQ